MKVNLVFRTKQNMIITREIEIDPGLKDTIGIYDNGINYLFQLECVGIQWIPGPPEVEKMTNSEEFEENMANLLEYGDKMGFLEVKELPKKGEGESI